MANAPSLPSNTLLQVNSPWRTARVFSERLLNSNFPCTRQSLDTPRDYLHAKHDPTQRDTQDVRRLLQGPSKSSVDSDWTTRVVSPQVVRTIPISKWYDDWGVVSSPDMPQHAKHCSHAACFVDGESHQAKLVSCHVVLHRCLARSHHVTWCLAMSRLRLEFVTRRRASRKSADTHGEKDIQN